MQTLTPEQLDALQELINIGVGRAANSLNEMVNCSIRLEVPVVRVYRGEELQQELSRRFRKGCFSAVRLGFNGSFRGTAELVFPSDSASTLVALLTGEAPTSPDLDALKIGTLSEIGNIVINGVLGSMSNVLNQHMTYKLPVYLEDTIEKLLLFDYYTDSDTIFLLAQARFQIEQLEIVGDLILIFEVTSFDSLLEVINAEIGAFL